MAEKFNLNCENTNCSNCGQVKATRDGLCSKCLVEEEYSDWENELEQKRKGGRGSASKMIVHSLGLKKKSTRGQEKIAKVKPVKINIKFKKK